MSYVRAKKFGNGRVYYYLVEGYRDKNDGGKVKQRVLEYLGKNPSLDENKRPVDPIGITRV